MAKVTTRAATKKRPTTTRLCSLGKRLRVKALDYCVFCGFLIDQNPCPCSTLIAFGTKANTPPPFKPKESAATDRVSPAATAAAVNMSQDDMVLAELAYRLSPDDEPDDKQCSAFAAAANGSGRTPAQLQRGIASIEAASANAGTVSITPRPTFGLPRATITRRARRW